MWYLSTYVWVLAVKSMTINKQATIRRTTDDRLRVRDWGERMNLTKKEGEIEWTVMDGWERLKWENQT